MDVRYTFSYLLILMMMTASEHLILQHKKATNCRKHATPISRYRYRAPIPYNQLSRFTFVGMQAVLCFHLTRFTPDEIHRLLLLLCLYEIRFYNRFEATPEEAFAVVLIRLSYSTRYWSMMDRFGHSRTWLSIVFNDTIIHLYRQYRKTLEWDAKRLTFEKLSEYAWAIHNLGGGHCFWGFIDGTLNATCRPVVDQEEFYSGHKQKYGYKYQSVVTPNGLVSSLMGPFICRRGDWKMVELSGLETKLCAVNQRRCPCMTLYLYGDPAYCTVYSIMGPYKNYPNWPGTAAHNRFNKTMAKLRIEVEHGFALHQNLWTWNGFHLGLKLQQGAAVCYALAVLLANAWTCMRGNQTSLRFRCMPPVLENYLFLQENDDEDMELRSSDENEERENLM